MTGHAFILHLTRASARRENAHRLRDSCGLPAEIWPAVDGAAMDDRELRARVDAGLFAPRYPFPLRMGEIGCFLSHRQIWAEILRRDLDHALILEDDVALDQDVFPTALTLAQKHVNRFGYVQLQNRPPRNPGEVIASEEQARLTQPLISPVRASAQVVSRRGAEHLLHHCERFDRPVDTFVQSHWFTGLRPAVVFPAGVRTISDDLEGSTIQTGGKTPIERIKREIARGFYRQALARASKTSKANFHKVQ
ncbi:glycosyltransferase family 25 protein [Roseovarius sp.]|uniref:glycosyltransferase family 25 protein n=1 Tax=Roseovarius sp. TaxID=1486281 RepID=UPI000C6230ED|nr:glycosyltransferase family 25 protein [Roseovarius sp.]MAO25730.1 glycosyl transferase family 25 [Roseovarius sp.]MAZ20945.1 glycosyl transferase family 25 [Roseovarius sp.]